MDYINDFKKSNCKCCFGTGVQYNRLTGLRIKCPCCGGTGKDRNKKPLHHFIPRTD